MPAQVIDMFCGIGGLTRGLISSGLQVTAGFDLDSTCHYAYENNNGVPFIEANIRDVSAEDINQYYANDAIKILVGCAPCQPFSQMRFKLGDANINDEKYNLLLEFGRVIEQVRPTIVSMENVPKIRNTNVFQQFLTLLRSNGYHVSYSVVYCPDYGIAQNRRRFVLLASLLGDIELIQPTHNRANVTVDAFIQGLPVVAAGEDNLDDPLHKTARLNDVNLERIRNSKPGGTWHDWPEELRAACHRKASGQTYTSVYSRMSWDKIGPTITTQFYCFGTGRFGHPEQDRALTLREGALLQTFPRDYNFIDPNRGFNLRNIARHIGNAVPVRLGEVIGESITQHLDNHNLVD